MPREMPLTSSMTPLRARPADVLPRRWRTETQLVGDFGRVGGAPVRSMALCTRSRICCWRSVSLAFRAWRCPCVREVAGELNVHPAPVFLSSFQKNAKNFLRSFVFWAPRHDCGHAADAGDHLGYTAAQLGVDALLRSVPALPSCRIESEQVRKSDSKDMEFASGAGSPSGWRSTCRGLRWAAS